MIATPAVRLSLLSMLLLALLCSLSWSAPMKWTLGGYLQARVTDQLGTGSTPSTFQDKRTALLFRAMDDEHIFLQFFVAGETSFEIQHAFASYIANPYQVSLGLRPIPFGYENPVTSAKLITTERSQVSAKLIGPNALDRGVYAYYLPGKGFNASVGVVNGQAYTIASDANNAKNIVARLAAYIPGGELGLSTIQGKDAAAVNPQDMKRYCLDLETKWQDFTVLSELIAGTNGEGAAKVDANGGYLTVAYRKAKSNCEPYVRLDTFDPNNDLGGDSFSRVTVGGSYYLNPTSKIQLEYENINDNLQPNLDGRLTGQFQIIF